MVIVDMMVTSTSQMTSEKHHLHMVEVLDGKRKTKRSVIYKWINI